MHSPSFKLIMTTVFALLFQSAALAADRHTRDEAVLFVKNAVAYIKQNGKEKAMAEFNNPAGQFVDGESYIVALDLDGVLLADGAKPRLVGKSLFDIKDMNGKYFVREEIALAKSKGRGWVDFEWVNPLTQALEPRSSYFERVDDYLIVTGVYQRR